MVDQQAEIGMGLDSITPGEEQERDPGLDEDEELEEDEEEAAKRAGMLQDEGSNQLEHDGYGKCFLLSHNKLEADHLAQSQNHFQRARQTR